MAPFKLFQTIQVNITSFPCKTSTAKSILTQATKHIAFQPGLIPINQESKQFLLEAIKTHNPKSIDDQLDSTMLKPKVTLDRVLERFDTLIQADPSYTLD
jgi:hypothetical protein